MAVDEGNSVLELACGSGAFWDADAEKHLKCVGETRKCQQIADGAAACMLPKICADPYDQVQLLAIKLLAVFLERPKWRNILRETCQPVLQEIVSTFDPDATDMTRTKPFLARSAERTLPLFNKVGEPSAF